MGKNERGSRGTSNNKNNNNNNNKGGNNNNNNGNFKNGYSIFKCNGKSER
ncbi:hypothetical protein DDB_G0285367 [Dictyostelium discoideum AX4]|nr:hypothetical protein DDB_G0285367 [Dictyostelium discoideum AX4]EAL64758.1 hypothetical protein DDB_G0285367 [Dictyostelium discoideum AX4]|eukprot:XP_638269.1 hypothetical protein DDB_G0285367 [Dictyostelium discoideum AX4]